MGWQIADGLQALAYRPASQMTRLGSALRTFEERGHERWLILGLGSSPLSFDEGKFFVGVSCL